MTGETGEALKEKVLRTFQKLLDADRELQKAEKALIEGGGYAEAYDYAGRMGDLLAEAYSRHVPELLVDSSLPEFDVISEIFTEPAEDIYWRSVNAAKLAQANINAQYGLNLNGVTPKYDSSAVGSMVHALSTSRSGEEMLSRMRKEIPTMTDRAVDGVIQSNAKAHYRAGINATLTRRVVADCCPWCSARAGTYEYPKVPSDVYKRHSGCRCVIEYKPENGNGQVQNVHSKEWGPEESENVRDHVERLERETPGKDVTAEYLRNARPGEGKLTVEDGVLDRKSGPQEVRIAETLQKTFGGDITVRMEKYDGKSSPDYLWNGKLWDLKEPTSPNAINKRLKKGLEQIAENQGGVIINLSGAGATIPAREVDYQIANRIQTSLHSGTVDVIILRDGQIEKVSRFSK